MHRLALAFTVLAVPAAQAQSAAPKFEVASIKLWVPGSGIHLDECTGDRYIFAGPRFWNVLQWTYELHGAAGEEFRQRVPASIREKAYDIQAKAAGPITSESQCRLMVKALLEDRFKLVFIMKRGMLKSSTWWWRAAGQE